MDRDALVTLLRGQLPEYPIASIVPLGEGQENAAFAVSSPTGPPLVLRISKEPDPETRRAVVDREARLLALVAQRTSLPIPQPLFAVDGAMAYRRVPGVPLLEVPARSRQPAAVGVAAVLGRFLAEMQAIAVDLVTELVDPDDDALDQWLADAVESWAAIDSIPAVRAVLTQYRTRIGAFLRATPPPARPGLVFSHNDLGIEHVLVDPDSLEVTGVIDLSDAALVDPAYDFALLLRDLGPAAFTTAVRSAGVRRDDGFDDRAWLYARCSVLEDLQYGLEHDRSEYVQKSLLSLGWLFPG